ncbi:phage tail tape measure protein [Gilliamella apis]|uniref:phage tail tape measure protein n=1 Tax=Gilliamella apis TaxID=1970738 RepID=UPI000A3394C8|nr:phage tail tape measure protein [Gilliamella apis]OTQ71579.1 phage tail tape measure protein [Gilliamella apis]OTQ74893.1 phage tail tape measure protein [Gilliamella apis]
MAKKINKNSKQNNRSRAKNKNKPQSKTKSSETSQAKNDNEQADAKNTDKKSDDKEKTSKQSKKLKELGKNLGKPVLNSVGSFIELEKAMNKVARQVKGLYDLQGKPTELFDSMKEQIQSLSQQIPTAKGALDIAEQVESNAKLGLTKQSDPLSEQHKQLLNFTKISAISANAFGLPVKELATDLSKIAKLFNIPTENIENLADTINYLSDNTNANAADIISSLKGMEEIADKLDFKQVMALNSAFLNMNIKPEGAIAATNAIVNSLSKATTQSEQFQQTLQSLGFDATQIEKNMSIDAIDTIQKVLTTIKQQKTTQQTEILTKLFGSEQAQNTGKLTNNLPLLEQQQSVINNPNAMGSLQIKADIDSKSFASQFQLLKTTLANISTSMGGSMQGPIVSAMPWLTDLMANTQQWVNNHPTFVATFMEIISISSMASTALGTLGEIPIKTLTGAFKGLGTVITTVGRAFLLSPIGLVVLAIAAAALVIRKFWEPISAFFTGFWQGLTNEIQPVIDAFSFLGPVFTTIGDAIGGVINWFSELLSPMELTDEQFESCKSAGTSFGSVVGSILMAPIRLFESLSKIVGDTWDLIMTLPDKMAEIPNKIKELFTGENGLLTMFAKFGSDIIDGLINGIKNAWNSLKDSISDVASNICGWFKSKLGINSPSKIFKEFGVNTIEGYQIGIDGTQDLALDSMSKFADKVSTTAPQMPFNGINNSTNSIANPGMGNIQGGTSQYYITINAAPGMNEQELVKVITQELDRREQQQLFQIRSSLRDIY